MTTLEQYLAWKDQGYNGIPIVAEILSDLDTPLSLYLKVANKPYSYLLESGFNGEHWGRYSIVGLEAHARITVKQHLVTHFKQHRVINEVRLDQPLDYIESVLASYKVPFVDHLPRFTGGYVGYFGYDTIRYIEKKLAHCALKDTLDIPDICLMLSQELLVHDNLTSKVYVIVYAHPAEENAYQDAIQRIQAIKQQLQSCHIEQKLRPEEKKSPPSETNFVANMSKEAYENKVAAARHYFEAGDVMQLILSQRFTKPFDQDPLHLYRTLRHLNPSPYMYYLNLDDFQIVGASPEILVRFEQGKATVRPLAGTRPRGKTVSEDLQLEKELLADTKEVAEHVMLIDLGRNDIGRVCRIGSVNVTEQMVIERFSHVMHISSTVEGEVDSRFTLLDVLKATFPAGTVSGAPKIHAMELIDQLEEEKRALYGGAVGYLGWNGNMDMALALRTAIVKDKQIHIQTGAGLVADSNPTNEWQECVNKGKALFLATELTESNLFELDT